LRKLLSILVLALCLGGWPSAYAADEGQSAKSAETTSQQKEKKADTREDDGMMIFWLAFLGAILFVLSSATALNSLGGKPPPRRNGDGAEPDRKKNVAEGKDRFRL